MTDPDTTALRPTPPVSPASAAPPQPGPADLRPALRKLGSGLIVYGVIGLVLAFAGLLALLYVGSRIGGLAERTADRVDTVIATLEDASTALLDAGATAGSFAVTLERTPPTVQQAAETIGSVQSQLRSVSSQLSVLSILGANPLSGVADLFGNIATNLEGLDTRLNLIADDLGDNRDKLLANARSLTALGERLRTVADDLREGVVEDSLADVQLIVTLLAFVFVIWTAVPAVGALLLGRWLRRELAPIAPA